MTNLNELVSRVEAATGPTFVLDVEISKAVGWEDALPPGRFTCSLDAAASLVPKGCRFDLYSPLTDDSHAIASVWWKPNGTALKSSRDPAVACGATVEIALTAAALRAISAQQETSRG